MPLENQATLSSLGDVILSGDATTSDEWCYVEWSNWWRMKKAKVIRIADDGTPSVLAFGTGVKGDINLRIPWCPAVLFTALQALVNTVGSGSHVTAVLYHPQLGTKTLEVEVVSLRASDQDGQYQDGDPIQDVSVVLACYGNA